MNAYQPIDDDEQTPPTPPPDPSPLLQELIDWVEDGLSRGVPVGASIQRSPGNR